MPVTVENYLKCCRVCLGSEKHEFFVHIFKNNVLGTDISLGAALVKMTGIECSVDDHLPAQICKSCQLRLHDAHNFIVEGRKNHVLLESLKADAMKKEDRKQTTVQVTIKQDPVDSTNDPLGESGAVHASSSRETFQIEYLDEEGTGDDVVHIEREYGGGGDVEASSDMDHDEVDDQSEQSSDGSDQQSELEEPDKATDAVDFILQNFKSSAKPKTKKKQRSQTRRHQCEVCNKTFQRKSNLVDHLRLHANVKLFSCNFCDASFVQAGNLKAHIRIHTLEKPYSCSICDKSYSQSSALKTHFRSHTNTKDYVCDVCNKGFTNKSDLTKHKATHTDLRFLQCVVCVERYFVQKVHLKKHLIVHHADCDFEDLLRRGMLKEGVRVHVPKKVRSNPYKC